MPAEDFSKLTMLTDLRLCYLFFLKKKKKRKLHYTVYQLCYVTYGSDYPFHSLCKALDSLHITANRRRGTVQQISASVCA